MRFSCAARNRPRGRKVSRADRDTNHVLVMPVLEGVMRVMFQAVCSNVRVDVQIGVRLRNPKVPNFVSIFTDRGEFQNT